MSGQKCDRPAAGWWCMRDGGHDGPCAALPVSPAHQCGDRGGTGEGDGVHCDRERGHDGPHRMEW